MHHMATQLVDAGADGLVLFNRFCEPDIDLASFGGRCTSIFLNGDPPPPSMKTNLDRI